MQPQGMANVSYWADDVVAARDWYAQVLGIDAYFARPEPPEQPSYVEFRVGPDGDELGIVDRRFGPPVADRPGGVVLYWHVDDVAATLARLVELGATELEAVTDRGEGFTTASVIDPFGNIFGIMRNPHWAELHA